MDLGRSMSRIQEGENCIKVWPFPPCTHRHPTRITASYVLSKVVLSIEYVLKTVPAQYHKLQA